MRSLFILIYAILILALGACAVIARRTRLPGWASASLLVIALALPILGKLLVLAARGEGLAKLGYYLYYLGMDLVMYALLRFALEYCHISRLRPPVHIAVCAILLLDAIQLICGVFFGHAFSLEETSLGGFPYFLVDPGPGQIFHRVVDYGFQAAVLLILFLELFRVSRINARRYLAILAAMLMCAVWEAVYVISGTPVDNFLVCLGFFGILAYYLALYYRPARLMDRMLAAIAAELPEALYFFDSNGRCVWANEAGTRLAGVRADSFEKANQWLLSTFGSLEENGEGWTVQRIMGEGEDTRCYVLEKHLLTDVRGREAGSFLRIRDNTKEQRTLQKEIYNSTHDSLTGAYNRAGYNALLTQLELEKTYLLMVDGDNFKGVNDTCGHETGDRILQKMTDRMKKSFRPEDHVCRVGGDEFVILVTHAEEQLAELIGRRIDRINAELRDPSDGLPPVSISAGIAYGAYAESFSQLYAQADQALYETKDKGKASYTFYRPEE